MTASGLFGGGVSHARTRPRQHALRYRVFMVLLDLDELDSLQSKLFGVNRPALLSFYERDHAGGGPGALKARIVAALQAAKLDLGGPIRLLCMPRMLGFVFNPISVYFCHHADGRLGALLYEVRNTFGERHSYLIPVPDGASAPIEQHCDKRFFVSPFMDMDMTYRFRVEPPGEHVSVQVEGLDAEGLLISARFAGLRRDLTDAGVLWAVGTHPMQTLGVVGAIHWEALKLFLKGVGLKRRPKAPAEPISVIR